MKIAVLKISGKTISEFTSTGIWINAIKNLYNDFQGIIIVHGAGKNISEWSEKLGHETKFINGQRVTSSQQMEVVAAVQAGLINSQLVAKLNSSKIEAIGLSGIDRGTFIANYFDNNLGYVGKPELTGSANWIIELLKDGIIPIFSSVCRDADGNLMNVNADLFAETLSLAIKADSVFFVSDVDGVKINGSVVNSLSEDEIISGIIDGYITDGMIPKLKSCIELLKMGINKIWIGSKLSEQENLNGTWIINKTESGYAKVGIA
ncbi:MAG: acetylglutamate kinase [Ignavibacteriaceae bacterium]